MSFERPSQSQESQEIIPKGASENFSDLQEQTGNIIQVYRSSAGDRIGVQVLSQNPDRGTQVTPLSPEIAEKNFGENEQEQAMNFYQKMIEALKEEAGKETDREKVFASLKEKIEA
jgi:hypothetical protein